MFMDEVNKATYHEMLRGGSKDPEHRRYMSQIRQTLRRAQRFAIDDDAIHLAADLAMDIYRLELWSILARIPYDTVWFEFNQHAKLWSMQRMGRLPHQFNPDESSQQVGYLLQKDLDSNTRWIATSFIRVPSEIGGSVAITCDPLAMVFDPEGSVDKPVHGATLWNMPTLSKLPGFPKVPVSTSNMKLHDELDQDISEYTPLKADVEYVMMGILRSNPEGTALFLNPAEWTQYKVGAVIHPIYWELSKYIGMNGLEEIAIRDAMERAGLLKFLICLLAMINDVPKTVKHITRTGSTYTKAGPIKYMDYSVISLTIPKGKQIQYVKNTLNKSAVQAHRKWHRVRGHWRIIEMGKRLPFICRHEPTLVDNGVAICQRCERMIRWIEVPNGRGDPRLGIVEHGYHVRGKG